MFLSFIMDVCVCVCVSVHVCMSMEKEGMSEMNSLFISRNISALLCSLLA